MPHIALLGDSILDNGAYTAGEPDVVTHLRRLLPDGWDATLCAVDGATTGGVPAQLSRVPHDASHLAVSMGGNDALQNSDLLWLRASSSAQVLSMFGERLARFERSYHHALDAALALGRHTILCTIYNGALEDDRAPLARVALSMFNDVILRTAFARGLDVIELRHICTEPGDYANPIEPSGRGGLKIAAAIAQAVGALPADAPPTRVWGPSLHCG